MVGGKKECDVNRGTAERAKRSLDGTIGRNPVTGKVTSKAELVGADNPTMNLETAQMNFGKKRSSWRKPKRFIKTTPALRIPAASIRRVKRLSRRN